MAVFDMFALSHIVHAAGRAGASLVAAAAFAVHRADIGRGVFFASAVSLSFARGGFGAMTMLLVGAAGRESNYSNRQSEENEFFHVY